MLLYLVFRVVDCRAAHDELARRGVAFLTPPQRPPWGGWRWPSAWWFSMMRTPQTITATLPEAHWPEVSSTLCMTTTALVVFKGLDDYLRAAKSTLDAGTSLDDLYHDDDHPKVPVTAPDQ